MECKIVSIFANDLNVHRCVGTCFDEGFAYETEKMGT